MLAYEFNFGLHRPIIIYTLHKGKIKIHQIFHAKNWYMI